MAKPFKPGIPDNFKFDVAPVSDLGDYLDEQPPTPIAKQGRELPTAERPYTPAPTPAAPVAPTRVVAVQAEEVRFKPQPEQPRAVNTDIPQSSFAAPPEPLLAQPAAVKERPRRPRLPRREINMKPETLRMTEELLEMIRGGSGQRDTGASEMLHAMVLLVYDVKDEVDLHAIPKRGQWGSPTARAYPVELKNAFLKAVQRRYGGV